MQINTARNGFENIKHIDQAGIEFWSARELMKSLGYSDWRNFVAVIEKAKGTLKNSYQQISDHFVEISKMIKIAKGTNKESTRELKDYKLTRYACYVIAQNGDSSKKEIAEAQSYFAIQTRKEELREEYGKDLERVKARERLRQTEKIFSGVLTDHQVDDKGQAEIRSSGDEALFNMSTRELKTRYSVPQSKPLADVLPTIALTAKQLATEMTSIKTKQEGLTGKSSIKRVHINNNRQIRKLLSDNEIFLETLPAEEDIEKIKKRIELNEEKIKELSLAPEVTISIIGVSSKEEIERISSIIKSNQGANVLKIIYGEKSKPKQIIRKVAISEELLIGLKKYLVV